MTKRNAFIPIAVVGVGALFAKSGNAKEYWKNIIEKRHLITEIPKDHWLTEDYFEPDKKLAHANDKIYSKWGSFIDLIDFDPVEFGVPPSTLPAIDTSQLLSLIVAKQVLTDVSQQKIDDLDLSQTSVILGTSVLEAIQYLSARIQRPVWANTLRQLGLSEALIEKACDRIADSYPKWQEDSFPGLLSNVVAGRIANRFNCGGTNCTTDAACASSLSAVSMAINELQLGLCNMVITGGVDTLNDLLMYKCFSAVTALSSLGYCRPFSEEADGTLLGEGIGLFALKRLDEAEAQGNSIYGVIRGVGTSSDGRSKSIYAPVTKAQSVAVRKAYEQAGYDINTVGLIEAHGTGTIAGDLAEYNGLLEAFKHSKHVKPNQCALGSVKSQIGHTKSAAGAAGLLKILFALRHKVLPATLHAEKINPKFQVKHSPLYLNTKVRPWISEASQPRRAGVSCFGFGGSNFHLTVEEYKNSKHQAKRFRTFKSELIILSAKSRDALLKEIHKMNQKDYLAHGISWIAYETQKALSEEQCYRLAIVADDVNDLSMKLQQALAALDKHSALTDQLLIGEGFYYGNNPTTHPSIAFCFPGQGSESLYMADDILMGFEEAMAVWEHLASQKLADHLTLAEVVYPPFNSEAKEQEQLTSRLKQICFAFPALTAVSLSYLALLKTLNVKPTCTTGQGISGLLALHTAGAIDLETLLTIAKTGKDEKDLAKLMAQLPFVEPKIPVYTNLENALYANKTNKSVRALAPQVTNAIKFSQSIRNLYEAGVKIFIEVGAGQTIHASVKEALADFNDYQVISLDQPFMNSVTSFWHALGQMICCGLNPKLLALWQVYQIPQSEKPSGKKMYAVKINGTNYKKPYPPVQNDFDLSNEKGSDTMKNNEFSPKQTNGSAEGVNNFMGEIKMFEPVSGMQQEIQRQLIEAHIHYQRVMTQTHLAFLNTISNISGTQNVFLPNIPLESPPLQEALRPAAKPRDPEMPQIIPQTSRGNGASPTFTPPFESFAPQVSAPSRYVSVSVPSVTTHSMANEPDVVEESADFKQLVLKIVVDKTGYPLEMLTEDMDIEADLGIDSIKRVEILSSLREVIPDLPEMDANELAALKTLQDVTQYVEKHSPEKKK